ncbi:MAG TPA: L-seryl-tRNA(Sec) selenium transferase [Pyrinomonadaceae bacterium]|nr:L-seryl-tRNA(Sec) selenium transferase [Pyrinomonadaceae bacterium]
MSKPKKVAESKLRFLPSVDQLLRTQEAEKLRASVGLRRLTAIARLVLSEMRTALRQETGREHTTATLLDEAVQRLQATCEMERSRGLSRVINATGVVLHTNLGRAPLSAAAVKAIVENVSRYCTLEYDSFSGTRGTRAARVEALLQELTGAEDALVVNNCAAAALLVLTVLAADGETLVSRGELVEIGGDFRVPDVMSNSGTRMVEVGTTNRTHLEDYRRALTANTRLIMRVHPSNFRIVGFSTAPSLTDLAKLAHEADLPLYEDAGSGQLIDLSQYGLKDEPTIRSLIEEGADVVTFSGDKLLGSAQAGIIAGKAKIVSQLRKHPLYRALRSDKLRLAALEATLTLIQRDQALSDIPVLQMFALTQAEIENRAQHLIKQVSSADGPLQLTLIAGESATGGGASPTAELPTTLIALTHKELSAQDLELRLRRHSPAIIARISDEQVLVDLRTVFPEEEDELVAALQALK